MTLQDQLPHIVTVKDRAKRKLERDAREILSALQDPETVEIMVNADGRIWQEKLGKKIQHIGNIQAAQVEAVIKTVAGYHGKEINRFNPIIEGEFPLDNSRFAGQLPPIVTAPTFAIRKKAIKIFTLEQYVETGVLSPRYRDVIKEAVRKHRNILVIGGTGSDKTTLINAIINEMVRSDPNERIFILEDTGVNGGVKRYQIARGKCTSRDRYTQGGIARKKCHNFECVKPHGIG